MASVYKESSEECLRFRQRGKSWMTADTWKAIDNRCPLKKKLTDARSEGLRKLYQQQYSEADRQVKRLTRADKRTLMVLQQRQRM